MKKKEMIIIAILAIISVLAIALMRTKLLVQPTVPAASAAETDTSSDSASPAGSETAADTETEKQEESDKSEQNSAEPVERDPSMFTVDIFYHNKVVKSFNPSVDNIYTLQGDYGQVQVEVKDGKWHVTNEECPNHVCSGMGWMGIDDIFPIYCMPNDIYVALRN